MKRTIAVLVFLASAATADPGKLSMTEGQWEITSEMTMETTTGMKQTSTAQPTKLCLTKKSPVPVDPKSSPHGMTCSIKHTVTGSDVGWTQSCQGTSSTAESTGTVTYADKTFSGSSDAVIKIKGGGDVKVAMKVNGKYLGACPK